jgi:hypothetical protein
MSNPEIKKSDDTRCILLAAADATPHAFRCSVTPNQRSFASPHLSRERKKEKKDWRWSTRKNSIEIGRGQKVGGFSCFNCILKYYLFNYRDGLQEHRFEIYDVCGWELQTRDSQMNNSEKYKKVVTTFYRQTVYPRQ